MVLIRRGTGTLITLKPFPIHGQIGLSGLSFRFHPSFLNINCTTVYIAEKWTLQLATCKPVLRIWIRSDPYLFGLMRIWIRTSGTGSGISLNKLSYPNFLVCVKDTYEYYRNPCCLTFWFLKVHISAKKFTRKKLATNLCGSGSGFGRFKSRIRIRIGILT
jgi:hypothetical protein